MDTKKMISLLKKDPVRTIVWLFVVFALVATLYLIDVFSTDALPAQDPCYEMMFHDKTYCVRDL